MTFQSKPTKEERSVSTVDVADVAEPEADTDESTLDLLSPPITHAAAENSATVGCRALSRVLMRGEGVRESTRCCLEADADLDSADPLPVAAAAVAAAAEAAVVCCKTMFHFSFVLSRRVGTKPVGAGLLCSDLSIWCLVVLGLIVCGVRC